MPQADETQDWLRDLREIHCPEAATQRIMNAIEASDRVRAAELLHMEKQALLQQMHEAEKRVDLADLLIYKLKRKEQTP